MKIKLQQQPTSAVFKTGVDEDGNVGGDCLYKSILNQNLHNLDIQYGMLYVVDKKLKSFDSVFTHHFWNTNEEGTIIYDGYDNLTRCMSDYGFGYRPFEYEPLDNWNIGIIDGDMFKNDTSWTDGNRKIVKWLNRNMKQYDAVYVFNRGYKKDHTLLDWDYVDSQINLVEEAMDKMGIFESYSTI